jgi:hypothetical protein
LVEHLAIEKAGIEGLVLRGSRYLPVHRQITEEQLHFLGSRQQFLPGAHLVELDIAANPLAISLLDADRVMLDSQYFPNLVHQFELGVGNKNPDVAALLTFCLARGAPCL